MRLEAAVPGERLAVYRPTANVNELRSVRCTNDATACSVAPEDVKRIAKDLGLPEVFENDRKLAAERSGDAIGLKLPRLPIPTLSAPALPQLRFSR
jgi:hypothetical protein